MGPAGRGLNHALVEAGISRDDVYVTNAVKHFKWAAAQRGQRRIHKNLAIRKFRRAGRGSMRRSNR